MSQLIIFVFLVISASIVLTFLGRFIWFFGVVKIYAIAEKSQICAWRTAFSTAILMNTLDVV